MAVHFAGKEIAMVWVDLDDTLIDFRSASRKALGQLYVDERLDRFFPHPAMWEAEYEKVNYDLWQRYSMANVTQQELRMERFRLPLVHADVVDEIARCMSARMDGAYLSHLADYSTLLPGARELLVYLRDLGLPIGVLSNGFSEVQQRKLQVTGLDKLVDIMVLSDEIGINKPDVRLFEHAMHRAGQTSPQKQLMIGDNATTDIAGALNAGWQALLFDPSLPLLQTASTRHVIVSSLDVIPTLIY